MSLTPFKAGDSLPALARPVSLSTSLACHVSPVFRDHYSPPGEPSPADIAEAKRKLAEAEHLCRPASARLVAAWCGRMKTLPWRPEDDEGVIRSVLAIGDACADLPTAAWTAESANIALRRWKRWPTPADAYELLSEMAAPFLRSRDQLRFIAAMKPAQPAPAREPPTNAAMQHVASIVQAFVSERRQAVASPMSAKIRARLLSQQELLATWEKAGADKLPGADARLAALRKATEHAEEVKPSVLTEPIAEPPNPRLSREAAQAAPAKRRAALAGRKMLDRGSGGQRPAA